MKRHFRNDPLEDIVAVGRVGPDAVQLWARTREAGSHLVRWWPDADPGTYRERRFEVPPQDPRDHTFAVCLEGSAADLEPLRRYRYRIEAERDSRLVGEGTFETGPSDAAQSPNRFAFAVMSCNQPFDDQGCVRGNATEMLAAAKTCLDEHRAQFVFMMGDQMYADLPERLSLFDPDYFATIAPEGRRRIQECTTSEVRRIYQRRYRHFWNVPGLKDLFSHFPCYMILDDHDIVDNWGSDAAHHTEEWRSLGEGARWAYFDYQGARVLPPSHELPPSFDYAMTYGHAAAFVMDLRSERIADEDGQLYSYEQQRRLREFLVQHRRHKVILLVLSVPPVHLPQLVAKVSTRLAPGGEDLSDRWTAPAHLRDRDRFLKMIREHQRHNPDQRVVILSGDIHVGCLHELQWQDDGPRLFQFVSSGLTNRASWPLQMGARGLIRLTRSVATTDEEVRAAVRLLPGTRGRDNNPYAFLNLGIVQIETPDPELPARLRFQLYGHRGEVPVCAYDSGWL